MSQKTGYKRRKVFIKKDYQLKFILKFCLILLAGALLSTGLLFLLSQGTLTSSFQDSRLVVKNTAFAIIPAVLLTNAITLVLISAAAIFIVLLISHKIAGPMFRFEKDLLEIGEGNLAKKVFLRKKDQFTDMGESLNHMTASLRVKVGVIYDEVEQLNESAKKQNAPEKLIEELNHLQQTILQSFNI